MPSPAPEARVQGLSLYPSARASAEWADVAPSVRNVSFFSACVEDERVLAAVRELVAKGIEAGWRTAEFVYEAENALDALRAYPPADAGDQFSESIDTLNDYNRLRLIFRTHNELAHGYAQFCEAFAPYDLTMNPGWRFERQEGAKEDQKRQDHVDHEGAVRLKTDLEFWLDRNRPEIGGFGNPYGPWGYNSFCYTEPVSREVCEALGLLRPGEQLTIPPALAEWNLPNVLQQMGTAGTRALDAVAVERIINRCAEEQGFTVAFDKEEAVLQIQPEEGTPLGALTNETFDAWLNENLEIQFEYD